MRMIKLSEILFLILKFPAVSVAVEKVSTPDCSTMETFLIGWPVESVTVPLILRTCAIPAIEMS